MLALKLEEADLEPKNESNLQVSGKERDTIQSLKKKCPHEDTLILFFLLFMTTPAAYGSSWAKGQIRATAPRLHHSHSNAGSELHLQPTRQRMAVLDPQPTEQAQGSNPNPHGYKLGS